MIMLPILGDSLYSDLALFLVRIVLGLIFMFHGAPKVKDLKVAAENFNAMGFRPGKFWGTLVGFVESIGGFLLIAGVLTQFLAAVFVIEFLVINIWKVRKNMHFDQAEFDLLILASLVVLLAFGGGSFSVDYIFGAPPIS